MRFELMLPVTVFGPLLRKRIMKPFDFTFFKKRSVLFVNINIHECQ